MFSPLLIFLPFKSNVNSLLTFIVLSILILDSNLIVSPAFAALIASSIVAYPTVPLFWTLTFGALETTVSTLPVFSITVPIASLLTSTLLTVESFDTLTCAPVPFTVIVFILPKTSTLAPFSTTTFGLEVPSLLTVTAPSSNTLTYSWFQFIYILWYFIYTSIFSKSYV